MKPRPRPEHIPERLLARLWRNRDWRRRSLALTGGRRLRVLYPGRPTSGPGPDFRDALLQVQGRHPVRGDVEVHTQSRGWREHGHHRDPRYNRVLLHVVARTAGGEHSPRHDGEDVPVVGLLGDDQELEEVLHATDAAGLSLPLLQRWRALATEQLCKLLDEAGRKRFLEKSARFQALLRQEDDEQLLYSRTMEALGYSRNRQPFLDLASRLPWSVVREAGSHTLPGERIPLIEGLLLRGAGLQSKGLFPVGRGGFETRPYAALPPHNRLVQRIVARIVPMDSSAWCFAGVRPQNQPHRRIAGAARLLARYIDSGFMPFLSSKVASEEAKEIRHAFTVAEGPISLIGPQRALDIVVNVVLPMFHARAIIAGDRALAGSCLRLYYGTPRLEGNEFTREMAVLLQLSARGIAVGALRQQGLMHLYQRLLQQGTPSLSGSALLKEEGCIYHPGGVRKAFLSKIATRNRMVSGMIANMSSRGWIQDVRWNPLLYTRYHVRRR